MELEKYLEMWTKGEAGEIVEYLAASIIAEEKGLIDVAQALKMIAFEEAMHGARAIVQWGKIGDLKSYIEKRIEEEKKAAEMRHNEAAHHEEPWKTLFEYTARDEERHARILQGLLQRLQ